MAGTVTQANGQGWNSLSTSILKSTEIHILSLLLNISTHSSLVYSYKQRQTMYCTQNVHNGNPVTPPPFFSLHGKLPLRGGRNLEQRVGGEMFMHSFPTAPSSPFPRQLFMPQKTRQVPITHIWVQPVIWPIHLFHTISHKGNIIFSSLVSTDPHPSPSPLLCTHTIPSQTHKRICVSYLFTRKGNNFWLLGQIHTFPPLFLYALSFQAYFPPF